MNFDITENALLGTLEHFNVVGPSDVYPLQPEYSLLLASPASTAKAIYKRLQCFDWTEKSAYAPAIAGYVETGLGALRRSLYIDPLLDILLTSLVAQLAQSIEHQRLPRHLNRVFSYRWKPRGGTWFDIEMGWSEFEIEERLCLQNAHFVAIVDIGRFYESIRPSTVEAALRSCGASRSQKIAVMKLLRLCSLDDFGLPIGGTASRILAEACLTPIDHALHLEGIHFIRFVDDFRIFADNLLDLKRALWFLGRALGNKGLALNKSKTRILSSQEYFDQLDVEPRSLLTRNAAGKASLVIDRYDPYSQLVGQCIEELKTISKTQSLDQALAYEFEKLEPSYRSLKFLFAALQFADPAEMKRALTMTFNQLETGMLNRLSLQLERAVGACAAHLSDDVKTKFSEILWHHVDNQQCSTPDGTVGHWIRTIGHLKVSWQASSIPEWRRRFSAAKHSLIVQRELLRLQILANNNSLLGVMQECESSGNPWLRGLCFALAKGKKTAVAQGTQLEQLMTHLK